MSDDAIPQEPVHNDDGSITLTLQAGPSGLPLRDFAKVLGSFEGVLTAIRKDVAPRSRIEWYVTELHNTEASASITVRAGEARRKAGR